jgi:MFS family permease
MTDDSAPAGLANSARRFLIPLALAQFICSFAGSNMNVMINDISEDLDTTVTGVQTAITLFLLIMAILMIPASKLTDRWGRKRCFTAGLVLYGIGALVSAVSPNLGVLILGNSVLDGVGTALLIPPVYILTTLRFSDLTSRAKAFGVISGLGGLGAAAGALIGGLITTAISWRAAFVFQALVVATIVLLSRRMVDPIAPDRRVASTRSERSCRRSACSSWCSASSRPTTTSRSWRCSLPSVLRSSFGSSSTSALKSERGRNRCCPPHCSRTAHPTSLSPLRTSSGCC